MKSNIRSLLGVAVLSVVLAGVASGCAWSVGGSKSETSGAPPPTRGQELIDLQKARDQGAISEEEYQRLKNCMLDI